MAALNGGFLLEVAELFLVVVVLFVLAAVGATAAPGFFLVPAVSFAGLPTCDIIVLDGSGGSCGGGVIPFDRDSAKSGYLPFK